MATTVTAEATVNDEIVFEAEGRECADGEYGFEDVRTEIIDEIEEELGWEIRVEERLVDGWDVELALFDEAGEQVGEGFIRA